MASPGEPCGSGSLLSFWGCRASVHPSLLEETPLRRQMASRAALSLIRVSVILREPKLPGRPSAFFFHASGRSASAGHVVVVRQLHRTIPLPCTPSFLSGLSRRNRTCIECGSCLAVRSIASSFLTYSVYPPKSPEWPPSGPRCGVGPLWKP